MSRAPRPRKNEPNNSGSIPGSLVLLFATLILVTAGIYWVSGEKRSSPAPAAAPANAVAPSPAATKVVSAVSPKAQAEVERGTAQVVLPDENGALLIPELAASARELNAADSTIQRDFEILDTLLESFRKFNGGTNPQGGENEEIVAALVGRSGKHLAVLPANHPFIDPRGRLLDRWGTPFHFHPVAYDTLEIRSAGPDRKLWTADDVSDP
jgi:hypothetical protein